MRTKKHLLVRMERCSDIIIEAPESIKGEWRNRFGNNNPVHLEIGCGKGSFVSRMAVMYPDINFAAMEKDKNVIITALETVKSMGLKNVLFMCENADMLEDYFDENECDGIYLNFSDPLPKEGYKKRRLTHSRYLEVYKKILKENMCIAQKTDNKGLFEFSLNSFAQCGFLLKNISLDLHAEEFYNNVVTEYELKFSQMGMPIYRLEAINKKSEMRKD